MTTSAASTSTTGTNPIQQWYAAQQAANSASSTSGTKSSDQETRFLKLLTAQLQNQDPMNPLDNAQTTSQLAQISTVTGIEKLNTTLNTMMSANQSNDTMQAASMVGHSVLLAGTHMKLSSGLAVGGVELDKPASKVTVAIYDANGKNVQNLELGSKEAGDAEFVWDGKDMNGNQLTDGTYSLKVTATDKDGSVKADTLELATVGSIVNTDSGVKLDVGSLGRVSLSDIKIIL